MNAPVTPDRPILQVTDLTMRYATRQGDVHAVDGVSLDLFPGQVLALVGESGCGKTSLAMALMKLLPDNARLVSGQVLLDGNDLAAMDENELRAFRWKRISMIFQAAMNSLDPVYRVADQIIEALNTHFPDMSSDDSREKVADLFELVGLDPDLAGRYPHEFSGGMRQRAVIAMAMACQPDVIIADEPTTALDVIVQGRILRGLKDIQSESGAGILYITHDMAVAAEVSDTIGVMYAGKLVEMGPTPEVFARAIHPYAASLMSASPSIKGEKRVLAALPGEPPNLIYPPTGCRFHPRCPLATAICGQEEPPINNRDGHWAACWNPLS